MQNGSTPHQRQSPQSTSANEVMLEQLRKTLPPEKILERTKLILDKIQNDNILEKDKKLKKDMVINRMLKMSHILHFNNIYFKTLQMKLKLLKNQHLFARYEKRLKEKSRNNFREEVELEALLEEEEEAEKLQRKKSQETSHTVPASSFFPMPHPDAFDPIQNAVTLGDNFLDLSTLLDSLKLEKGKFSLFLHEELEEIKNDMVELDLLPSTPEEFEKKLFNIVDKVDGAFRRAKASLSLDPKHTSALNVCYDCVSEDLTQWLKNGRVPRYTPAMKQEIQNRMEAPPTAPSQNADTLANTLNALKPDEGRSGDPIPLRERIQQEVDALKKAKREALVMFGLKQNEKETQSPTQTLASQASTHGSEPSSADPSKTLEPQDVKRSKPWDVPRVPKKPLPPTPDQG